MDNSKIEQLIADLKSIILNSFSGFKGIYLFGSRTTDNWESDSDLDLLLTFDRDLTWQEKKQIRNKIYETELNYNFLIDSKIYNLDDINNSKTPFRQNIKNNAIFYGI